jgi:hypothetical protein
MSESEKLRAAFVAGICTERIRNNPGSWDEIAIGNAKAEALRRFPDPQGETPEENVRRYAEGMMTMDDIAKGYAHEIIRLLDGAPWPGDKIATPPASKRWRCLKCGADVSGNDVHSSGEDDKSHRYCGGLVVPKGWAE